MSELDERLAVIAEAKTWLRTPYCSNAMVRGAGVDCAMLLLGVYQKLGYVSPDFNPRPYPPQWHLHRDEERYMNVVKQFGGREIDEKESGPGDVVLFKVGRVFAHGGIVIDWPIMIHARASLPVDIEDARRDIAGKHALWTLERKFFTLWPRNVE